jgi:hypothetical protein
MNYSSIEATSSICNKIPSLLPIDDIGTPIKDPYLSWIHDLFISCDGTEVHILAQNRRCCHMRKKHTQEVKFWEGQLALFQPVTLKRLKT